MTSLNVKLYKPQMEFVSSPKQFTALIGGIGSGKSVAGAAKAIAAAFGRVGNHTIPTPNMGMITAPTYNVLRDATLPTFRDMAGDLVDVKNSAFAPPIRLRMTNGSEVLMRSANNAEMLRGPSISWWWGDESALYSSIVWKIMLGRLRQFGTLGYLWLTTTPKGRNWIWKLFVEEHRSQYEMFRAKTAQNPFIDLAYYDALKDDYSGDFARQELEGEFISFEGLIYPQFSEDRHVVSQTPERFARVIAGQDWGFANPGVLQVIGVTSDERAYLIHEEHARRRGIDEWANVALQLRDTYGISEILCDPSEPDFIAKYIAKGIKARAADNTVSTGIQVVSRRLLPRADGVPGLLISRAAVNTISEFEQYQWAKRGSETLDQPVKANDHCQDALRYALMGVDTARKPIKAEVTHYA